MIYCLNLRRLTGTDPWSGCKINIARTGAGTSNGMSKLRPVRRTVLRASWWEIVQLGESTQHSGGITQTVIEPWRPWWLTDHGSLMLVSCCSLLILRIKQHEWQPMMMVSGVMMRVQRCGSLPLGGLRTWPFQRLMICICSWCFWLLAKVTNHCQ